MMPKPQFPLRVFFDGQCPLCSREIKHYLTLDEFGRLIPVDIAASNFQAQSYGLDAHLVQKVMHAQDATGTIYSRVDAFLAIWQAVRPTLATRLGLRLLRIRPVRKLADIAYMAFARNRYRLTGRCTPETCSK